MDKLKLIEAILGIGSQCSQSSESAFKVGEKLLIRSVTHYVTGRVKEDRGGFLFLEDAAWIPDTGRFSDALKTGTLEEVEPADGVVRLNRECVIDVYEWTHPLPRTQI